MAKKLFIDLDGVVFDTITTIVNLYNADHLYYKDFKPVMASDVKTWGFEELTLEPPEFIDRYFNTPRFFDELVMIRSADWIIKRLIKDGYQIIFCSCGSYPNLTLKKEWIFRHYPEAQFIPVDHSKYKDKRHIPMGDGDSIFIDDVYENLITSNAKYKVCFGKVYSWNEKWTRTRRETWEELYKYIKENE